MASTPRTPIYLPEFKGAIEGWVVNHMRSNYWRVASTIEREDVMQEAYVVFLRVKRRYPAVEGPKHFMSLFKMAWVNQFTDLANEDTARRAEVPMPSRRTDDGDEIAYEPVGELANAGELGVALSQAPSEVKAVLQLFLNAPQEILELALGSWQYGDKRRRATASSRVCRLLGLPETLDVMKITEEYFSKK